MTFTPLKIAPSGMRLHEWIALERGYFQAHGIEPIVRWDIVSGILSSWQWKAYKERPQDLRFVGTAEPVDVITHCAWGTVCNAGAGLGKFVPDAYGVARWAVYVRPDSPIRCPKDLADVPIAVGISAGSHFDVPYRLEEYLPLERIKTLNVGGFGARLIALLNHEVDATSLLDPQISMADQLGLRRVIGNTFKTLWVVPPTADRATLDVYLRVLQQADADLERDPASCLPLWRYSIPEEFKDHEWDFARFDVGERFHYAPLPRAEFEELLRAPAARRQESFTGQASTYAVPRKSRIILADDNAIARRALRTLLTVESDLEVVGEAANGREAIQMCRREHPDLVLLDMRMPEMDGLSAIPVLKRNWPTMRIIMVTFAVDMSTRAAAILAGADDYVEKGTVRTGLVAAIHRVLSK